MKCDYITGEKRSCNELAVYIYIYVCVWFLRQSDSTQLLVGLKGQIRNPNYNNDGTMKQMKMTKSVTVNW